MKTAIVLIISSCFGQALGNIPVSYEGKVILTCNQSLVDLPGYTGCLRGMSCVGDEM